MGTKDTIRRIEKKLGMSETYQVSTFTGIRTRADGSLQEVSVEVLNAGKGAGDRRYAITLRFEDGGDDIVGNPAASLNDALANVSAHLG